MLKHLLLIQSIGPLMQASSLIICFLYQHYTYTITLFLSHLYWSSTCTYTNCSKQNVWPNMPRGDARVFKSNNLKKKSPWIYIAKDTIIKNSWKFLQMPILWLFIMIKKSPWNMYILIFFKWLNSFQNEANIKKY